MNLIENKLINPFNQNEIKGYYIPLELILKKGIPFFKQNHNKLLCPSGTCSACDSRNHLITE
ncbi:MAG: hypothetical protein NTX22_01920 [Ignavibacteriales bacterium]|nr:hypothetical protein [Ignavibacteriales bacterium]